MSTVIGLLFFFAGVHLMILTLAAAYRFIDLWYRISEFWFSCTAKLSLLLLINGALISQLADAALSYFIAGQLGYLGFHIVGFWLVRLLLVLAESRHRRG